MAEEEEADGAIGGSNPRLQYSLFLPDPESVERLVDAPVKNVLKNETQPRTEVEAGASASGDHFTSNNNQGPKLQNFFSHDWWLSNLG